MSEENIGGEEGIIEERRKKLQLLRDKNKAYVNDFVKKHYAKSLHKDNDSFSQTQFSSICDGASTKSLGTDVPA